MRKIILAMSVAIFLSGCSVYMAAKQDDFVDVSIIKEGTSRALIIANFGAPTQSYQNSQKQPCEIFKFRQGYRQGTKVGRAAVHAVADVLTAGLWEVIGTPVEAGFNGDNVAWEVCYKDDVVISARSLTEYDGRSPEPVPASESENR